MKHLTMADKSLLVGDDAADLLVRYAALLAKMQSGDTVTLLAYGVDGAEVEAMFLLNSGTTLMSESTQSELPEPDNADQVAYLRDKIAAFESLSGDIETVTEEG